MKEDEFASVLVPPDLIQPAVTRKNDVHIETIPLVRDVEEGVSRWDRR